MSTPASLRPASDGATADTSTDPASDRRRVINNSSPDRRKAVHRVTPPSNSGDAGDGPTPDSAGDRRKIIHQNPSAENQESAPPDRRKIIHREPSADGREQGVSPDAAPTDRRKPIHHRPSAYALRGAEARPAREGHGSRPVGTRWIGAAQRVAATMMLLAMMGSIVSGALPAHVDGDGHAHEAPVQSADHVDIQESNLVSGIYALYTLAVSGWHALAGDDICGDCGLDVDDGCKCVCYSGGYDPDDPACQF